MSAMNTAQRAVLLLSALALLGLVWIPPSAGNYDRIEFWTLWERQWINPAIHFPALLAELIFLLTLTTLLVLAFKPRVK